jgi:hypothetical protein
MKVFNEIKAEVAGRIERVRSKRAAFWEYGQPLMLVAATGVERHDERRKIADGETKRRERE